MNKKKTWTSEEKKAFEEGFKEFGKKWKKIGYAYLEALRVRTFMTIEDFLDDPSY